MLTHQTTRRVEITTHGLSDAVSQCQDRVSVHDVLRDNFGHLIPGECQHRLTRVVTDFEGIAGEPVPSHPRVAWEMANSHSVAFLRKPTFWASTLHYLVTMQMANPNKPLNVTMPILHRTTKPLSPIRDIYSSTSITPSSMQVALRNMWSLHRVTTVPRSISRREAKYHSA